MESRAFIAAYPPAAVLEQVEALPRPVEPGVRWTLPEQWHVTLRFFDRVDLDAAVEALAAVEYPSVEATAGPTVSRLGRSVVCIPVEGLDGLAADVQRATGHLAAPESRPFAGHVTLARSKNRAACSVVGAPFATMWVVDELRLMRSRLGGEGAQHELVAVHPLGSRRVS